MRRTDLSLLMLSLVCLPSLAHGSPLSEAADALAPGAWVELATENIEAIGFGGHTGNALPYSQSAAWDPVDDTLHFIGEDHGEENPYYFQYVAETNTWTNLGATQFQGHGFEHLAIDPVGRQLFHRPYGGGPEARQMFAASLDAPTQWAEIESFPYGSYFGVALAIVYVPDFGLVVHNCSAGGAAVRDASGTWQIFGDWAGDQAYQCFADYSPDGDALVYGGGNNWDRRLWRLDRDGTITELAESPVSLGDSEMTSETGTTVHQANVAPAPNSGEFIVIGDGHAWSLDPTGTGTWKELPDPDLPGVAAPWMISAPLADHGVILYAACQGNDCHVYLYRHAPGSGMEPDTGGDSTGGEPGGSSGGDGGADGGATGGGGDDSGSGASGSDGAVPTTSPGSDGTGPGQDGNDVTRDGCACATSSGSRSATVWLFALAVLPWARRRRIAAR